MAKKPMSFRNMTAFVEGEGYGGKVEEGTPPVIAQEVFEHIAGGMGGTLDIPYGALQKMETDMMITGISAALTTVLGQEDASLTLKGAASDGSTTEAVEWQMRGLFHKLEAGTFKPNDKGSTKITGTLSYVKYSIGGRVLIEADVLGNQFIVDGVDKFADIRAALGE